MLYPIYTAIEQQLSTADTGNLLKGVEWYNVQYEGTIASTPRVFVEFPEKLTFDQISKQQRRTPIRVRLHVVSQAITSSDGTIDNSVPQQHEQTAQMVLNAIDKFTPTADGNALSTPLRFNAWQHFHKHKGWMVTFIEFEGRMVF